NQFPPTKGNVIGWAQIVLGYPGPAQSQVNQALALNPTTMFLALGNNDALVPAISGFLPLLTPLDVFSSQFSTVISRLATSRATLLVANIPDVTQIPYFTSPRTLAQQAGVPLSKVLTTLGIQEGDLLRRTAVSIALDILAGGAPPAPFVWPTSCPLPVPGLLPPGVPLPCILSATDGARIRSATVAYNAVIREQTARYGATLVDLNALVTKISRNGYKAGGYCLSTGFLGGLFSLDGIHPSNSGYGVIANLFIDRLNSAGNTRIKEVKVSKIAKVDPVVFPGSMCGDDDDDDDDDDDSDDDDDN
ncbi:MAG: hypothetical protein H7039_20930, partial [Bryobacteraceae bacterium]|nr:hypothetical protein [Bryobacteraceae bacterium]